VYEKKVRKRIGPLVTFMERGYVWNERRKTQVFGAFWWNMPSVSPWLLVSNPNVCKFKQNIYKAKPSHSTEDSGLFPEACGKSFQNWNRYCRDHVLQHSLYYFSKPPSLVFIYFLLYEFRCCLPERWPFNKVSRSSDFLRQVACVASVKGCLTIDSNRWTVFVWLSIGHRLADTNRCQLTNFIDWYCLID